MTSISLDSAIVRCMQKDQYRFSRQLSDINRLKDEDAKQEKLEQLMLRIAGSQKLRELRQQSLPEISYPDLPVAHKKDEIKALIEKHQVLIIAGETGSGKTTQIPKMCLELGRGVAGFIGHTQPRRLAARSVANRIAEELDTQVGQSVGFKVRFSDQVGDTSLVKLMTDGIMLAEIQQDRFLNQYDTIIIDEAHERSLNIDFLLGYLKQLLPKRPDLKLVITSATIDPERFSTHFDKAPIIEVSGRTYPVEIRYKDPAEFATSKSEANRSGSAKSKQEQSQGAEVDTSQMLLDAVDELMREAPGDILVFLSGERDIRDAADELTRHLAHTKYKNTEIIPLYARLSAAEQNRIFSAHAGRRIVLATNVAETSLTVPGIKYVIDTGVARISRYSQRLKVQRLPIEAISQASANQRAGRCGRVSNGICIRLYSEEDYLGRPEFTDPEIVRTHLSSVIIQMLALGLGEIKRFPFVQAPDDRNINDGVKLLEELQAVERAKGRLRLTPIGRAMAPLPLDPRYARMILEAKSFDAVYETIVITSGLSVQDPRERPQDKQQQADQAHAEFADNDSDFISLLNLWEAFKRQQKQLSNSQLRKWCKQHFIHFQRMREWQDIVSQIKQTLINIDLRINSQPADYEAIHRSLAIGLLSQIGMKDKNRQYLGARNSQFMIFPGSNVARSQPKWIMCAELVETSRLFARQVAKIEPQWLESIAKHVAKYHYAEPHWSKKRGAVMAYLTIQLFGLPIVTRRIVNYSQVDAKVCRDIFIREALVNAQTNLNYDFLTHNQRQIETVELLEKKARRRDILVDEDMLCYFYDEKLPEHVVSEVSFKKWWKSVSTKQPRLLHFDYEDLLKRDPSGISASDYPDTWRQGNLQLALTYHFEPNQTLDGVAIHIPVGLLNQVQDIGFDWLVPGMRHELITNLIKSLPKRLRRNFVPAPDYALAVLEDISMTGKNGAPVRIVDAVANKLFRISGTRVESEDFDLDSIATHLRFNFVANDSQGKMLASDKSLNQLKAKLKGELKETIEKVATPALEKDDVTSWDFGKLPETFTQKQAGYEIKAFPSLVLENNTVKVKLLDNASKAHLAHQRGLYQLIKMNVPSPVKYLQEKLPNKAKLSLYFNPFGQIKPLIDDIIIASIDSLVCAQQAPETVRSAENFKKICDHVRMNINDKALDIAKQIETGLAQANKVSKLIKGNIPLNMINNVKQIQMHLQQLVFKGFVSDFGEAKLPDWNRYLTALVMRAEKLKIDVNRDRLNQLEVDKAEQAYEALKTDLKNKHQDPAQAEDIRWMIEELRVSLFAQQLGTKFPISLKRIQHKIAEYK
uniref:ATP-dependent RNA helicase HrpA n=1 Tax=Ningiella ruwaisensis TaxID=2364274 RepID=UPI0010A095A9|nr:ATP-dependent RNA helicase HrpA [Ningiella ruwaisensis]